MAGRSGQRPPIDDASAHSAGAATAARVSAATGATADRSRHPRAARAPPSARANLPRPILPGSGDTRPAPRRACQTRWAAGISLAGANASPTLNAPDLGEILSKSPSAAGWSKSNAAMPVSSDPRIRGYRVGQFRNSRRRRHCFFPARQDLDTAVAKFDPGSRPGIS